MGWGYLWSELILGFSFLMIWNDFLFNFSGDFVSLLFLTVFLTIFFIIAISDLKYFIIPDKLVILGLILSIAFLFFKKGISIELFNNLFTAMVFSSVFFAIWFLSKKKWLGFGDVKLIGAIGLLFGFPGTLWVLYLAVAAGLVISLYLVLFKKADRKTPVPFGAFLSGAAIALILFEPQIGSFFLNLLI